MYKYKVKCQNVIKERKKGNFSETRGYSASLIAILSNLFEKLFSKVREPPWNHGVYVTQLDTLYKSRILQDILIIYRFYYKFLQKMLCSLKIPVKLTHNSKKYFSSLS